MAFCVFGLLLDGRRSPANSCRSIADEIRHRSELLQGNAIAFHFNKPLAVRVISMFHRRDFG